MFACHAEHPALPALFDPAIPDNPVLWAVFQGRNAGRALVDNNRNPSQCVVRTDAILTFASQQIDQAFLHESIAYIRETDALWLVWPNTMVARVLPPDEPKVVERYEFYDYDYQSLMQAKRKQRLPDGFEIRPIDRNLLERCEWGPEMEFYCGSGENFLENGIGLCLMRGEEIIVEAYASSLGDQMAEIGAITREAYRGFGYAPMACAFLMEACEQRGYHAYWSCDKDNPASIRVAQKLGFRIQKSYQILEYDQNQACV